MVRGQRKGRRTKLTQRGEAVFRRKPRLSDTTAERVAMALLLGKQALKSIKNNADIVPRCRRQQSGVRLLRVLSTAAKQGLKLSRSEGYRRYGAKNARGHFERRAATWEVYKEEKERSLTFSYDNETRNFVMYRTRFYWIIKRKPKLHVLILGGGSVIFVPKGGGGPCVFYQPHIQMLRPTPYTI